MANNLHIRYDRQIRLWGDQGQHSIASAEVAVIGSSALASEILKNLVLAGIKSYCIFDTALVSESDTGNNFFVDRGDVGNPRAKVLVNNLTELNPTVKGSYKEASFAANSKFEVLSTFSLVIGCRLKQEVVVAMGDYLYERNIPFIWSTTLGLIGYFRIAFREHHVVDDHREDPPHDFRIQEPFLALKKHVATIDLDSLTHEAHGHTPFLILYLKALDKWRQQVGDMDALPANYNQRKTFLSVLMEMQQCNAQGIYNEENFDEAKRHLVKSFANLELNENVRCLFRDNQANPHAWNESTSRFWIYVAAIKQFYDEHSYLPLSGSLPDMISDTISYTNLLNLYREEAAKNAKEVYMLAKEFLHESGLSHEISLDECKRLCKNAARLHAFFGKPISSEVNASLKNVFAKLLDGLQDASMDIERSSPEEGDGNGADNGEPNVPKPNPLVWIIMLRAANSFFMGKNRYPGTNGVPCDIDSKDLRARVMTLAKETNDDEVASRIRELVPDYAVEEIARFGNSELNVIASILGGIVAQEAIKLCTQQYIPVNNTFVFDGHTQTSVEVML